MIKAMIVDDEKIAITVLKEMLKEYENVKVVGTYTNPNEALSDLSKLKPNVIFLDIELGETNGIEMGEKFLNVYQDTEIIFVTAYSEYAIEAFELNAIDYLLKPVIPKRLDTAISRLNPCTPIPTNKGLYIQSFGYFIVLDETNTPIKWRTAKSKELFAFLWSHQEEVLERNYLIETLFPERDANKATTLFSTTLYQMRKNLSQYFKGDFIKQVNRGYTLDIEIDSDVKKLQTIILSNQYASSDIQTIKELYKHCFLEFEDYTWKDDIESNLRNHLKIYLFNHLSTLKDNAVESVIKEETLMFLYELDKTDDNLVQRIATHYKTTNQITKLKTFYQDHIIYLEKEMDLKPPTHIKEIINNI